MKKLWQKDWHLNTTLETFETKDDILLDQKLVKFDVAASIAHAQMLKRIGILNNDESTILKTGLLEVLKLSEEGKFELKPGDEDIHTKIENYLTQKHGEVGKKIHTGRSRNDQVLTDLRLYSKDKLLQIEQQTLKLAESFLKFAKAYEFIALPGFTHMQKGMPSSLGMWAGSFVEGLLDDLQVLDTAFELSDQSPLGSAAGYGTPLPLDREYTAKLLGFSKVQSNTLYCQNSRGKIDGVTISALMTVLQEINKFASDIMLFTTSDFNYLTVASELCSGSSIMPQKKNVDIGELLRSKVHLVLGNLTSLISLTSNLISGYNRDIQDSKKLLIESLETTLDCLVVANLLINNIEPNEESLKQAMTGELFAAHQAFELVNAGKTFRDAYHIISSQINYDQVADVLTPLKQSKHLGGTGNLGLDKLSKQLEKQNQIVKSKANEYQQTWQNLLS